MQMLSLKQLIIISVLALLFSAPLSAGEKPKFYWKDNSEAGTADLLFGNQPVLRYMYAYDKSTKERAHETYKVYHHVFGPNTKTIITKGPGGKYTHHRGLYVGWNKTSFEGHTLDFWHCTKGAHQRHAKFINKQGGDKSGTMTAEIHWNDAYGKPVITETRTISVSHELVDTVPGYVWQIDWSTKLQSNRGEITLGGDRQHAGFQFRAAQPVAENNSAVYVRPKGFPQDPAPYQVNDRTDPDKHVNLGWLAMTYNIDGKHFTTEYFEDPSLPKPSRYSERPYGRFGAFFKTTLKEEKPLTMRYRLRISAGKASSGAAIQKRYDQFVSDLK